MDTQLLTRYFWCMKTNIFIIFTLFKWYVYSLNVAGSSLYLILMVLDMWALWFCHGCNLMVIFYMFYTMFIFHLFCSDWNEKKLCLPERVYIYLVSCFENVWALDVRYLQCTVYVHFTEYHSLEGADDTSISNLWHKSSAWLNCLYFNIMFFLLIFLCKMNLVWSALQPFFFPIRHSNLQYGLFLIWRHKLICKVLKSGKGRILLQKYFWVTVGAL